jgi:hypothetical protein
MEEVKISSYSEDEKNIHLSSQSRTTKRQIAQHEIEDIWESCCFKLDRRSVEFFSRLTIILLSLIFCFERLTKLEQCDAQPYLGLLTLLIGIIIPSPTIQKKK